MRPCPILNENPIFQVRDCCRYELVYESGSITPVGPQNTTFDTFQPSNLIGRQTYKCAYTSKGPTSGAVNIHGAGHCSSEVDITEIAERKELRTGPRLRYSVPHVRFLPLAILFLSIFPTRMLAMEVEPTPALTPQEHSKTRSTMPHFES